MRMHARGFTLSAVVYVLRSAHHALAQQIPSGCDPLTDACVSKTLLVAGDAKPRQAVRSYDST